MNLIYLIIFYILKVYLNQLDLGISNRFKKFMNSTKYKFEKGLSKFIKYENLSISEYLNFKLFYYIYKFELLNLIEMFVIKYLKIITLEKY